MAKELTFILVRVGISSPFRARIVVDLIRLRQGACGWTATSKDHIAALNKDQYGDVSQESPHCGHYIWITNTQTGASTRAQVQGEPMSTNDTSDCSLLDWPDACPGCNYGDLDLSPAAFDDLAPESQGVVQIE